MKQLVDFLRRLETCVGEESAHAVVEGNICEAGIVGEEEAEDRDIGCCEEGGDYFGVLREGDGGVGGEQVGNDLGVLV